MTVKMAEIRGYVVSRKGQRAIVKVDKEKSTKRGLPTMLDCWNNIEAKPGEIVEVEMRSMDDRNAKLMIYGIPICSLLAGIAFGNAMAGFFGTDKLITIGISVVLWLIMGFTYASNFKRDVAGRGEQPVIKALIDDNY